MRYTVVVVLALMLLSPVNTRAWYARWDLHHPDPEDKYSEWYQKHYHLTEKTHNWITYQAIMALRKAGRLPFPLSLNYEKGAPKPHGRGTPFTAFELISYGLWYADHVWAGPPENKNQRIDVQNVLEGLVFDRDEEGNTEVKVQWRRDHTVEDEYRANTYLEASYKGRYSYGADNLYHYSNDADVEFQWTIWFLDDETAFEDSLIGASNYSYALYLLGSSFLSGWADRIPSTDKMLYFRRKVFSHPMDNGLSDGNDDTGNITMDDPGAGPQPRAHFPSFYAGGNPFICVYEPNNFSNDICENSRKPTWPVWAVDFDYVVSNPDVLKDNDLLHGNRDFRKSKRVALIYLGWVLHLIQDLSNPNHAKNRTGLAHEKCEGRVEEWIVHNQGWFQYDTEIGGLIDNMSQLTYNEICDPIGLGETLDFDKMMQTLEGLRAYARSQHYDFHNRGESGSAFHPDLSTTRKLFRKAIDISMKYIYCFSSTMDLRGPINYHADLWNHRNVEIQDMTFESGFEKHISATNKIVLKPGFEAKNGSEVVFFIEN